MKQKILTDGYKGRITLINTNEKFSIVDYLIEGGFDYYDALGVVEKIERERVEGGLVSKSVYFGKRLVRFSQMRADSMTLYCKQVG